MIETKFVDDENMREVPVDRLTVRELIAELQEIEAEHGDLPTVSEGCDCDGYCARVEVRDGFVILARDVRR